MCLTPSFVSRTVPSSINIKYIQICIWNITNTFIFIESCKITISVCHEFAQLSDNFLMLSIIHTMPMCYTQSYPCFFKFIYNMKFN